MPIDFHIDPKLLKKKNAQAEFRWRLWEKKNLNIHRAVIEWVVPDSFKSIDDVAVRVRKGVCEEFRPGRFRGLGFGAILYFDKQPPGFYRFDEHIDRRQRSREIWQWVIAIIEKDRLAVGVHTWLPGYLRPVYDSILAQLSAAGFECHAADTGKDTFIENSERVQEVFSLSSWLFWILGLRERPGSRRHPPAEGP
ncbi:MAG: hypothetical protein JW818_16265 [Pirellulales bacterium]|nr:hypothetical protein [Pirellulales bacterium]